MNVNGDDTTSPRTKNEEADSTVKTVDDGYLYVHSAVRTPPPPGFSLSDGFGLLGENRKGAESAPPIAFRLETNALDENSESIFSRTLGDDGKESAFGQSSHMNGMRMMQRPISQNGELLQPSDLGVNGTRRVPARSSSFTNLAAVLGQGLAESMGDSLQDEHKTNRLSDVETK